jgi:uncharacterized protein (TIGR00290 family)
MTKAIFNWSGGKDSALSLRKVLQMKQYEIICLLTSVNEQHQRISMHGVRVELLHKQAESIGLPLLKIQIPEMPTMEDYDNIMAETLKGLKSKGVEVSVFGDIFLEDLRAYREVKLAEVNLKGVFPLWKIPTKELIREFLDLGFKTITTCVNDKYLDKSFAGRIIDEDFLKDLPENVDPCGENGEFHTFVFDGPIFAKPIPFVKGEIVYKKYTPSKKEDNSSYDCKTDKEETPFDNGFWYCDLLPIENKQ